MSASIIRADARNLPLADDSVDLVVTSPPYFALRSYQDGGEHYAGQIGSEPTPTEFVDALLEVTRECMRVLKPSGSIWVNLGDKYAGQGRSAVGSPGSSSVQSPADSSRSAQSPQYPSQPSPYPENSLPQSRHFAMSPSIGPLAGMKQGARNGNRRSRPAPVDGIPGKSLMGIPWRYAIRCIDELGLILRAEVIWSKPNGLPESVTDRVRRSHEQWFHFTKSPRYYSAVDEIREAYAPSSLDTYARGGLVASVGSATHPSKANAQRQRRDGNEESWRGNALGKLPGSVWTIATQPLKVPADLGVDHFAAFPMEWPRRLVKAWSPPGGVVLDPFGGTGTTALVAKALGRVGISVDMSADYCRLAQWRTTDEAQLAKAMRVEKPAKQVEGQISMLDLLNEEGGAA